MLVSIGSSSPADNTLLGMLAACHRRIRHYLGLARRLSDTKDAPLAEIADAAAAVRRYFVLALPLHVADEDELIAPRLRRGTGPVVAALRTMTEHHADHKRLLDWLVTLLGRIEAAPDQLPAIRPMLAQTVSLLVPMLEAHLELEERVIFPALARLPRDEQARIVDEMRERRADTPILAG